jgi:small subunit ribosomal protein S17
MSETSAPPAKRPLRKTRIGTVVSAKMDRTVVVEVIRRVPHPKFKKIVKRTAKFYAHDENREAKEGQKVRIMECRPMSKLKRWRVIEILAH